MKPLAILLCGALTMTAAAPEFTADGEWAFFGFGPNVKSAKALGQSANCYECHPKNGAVEQTFVQFYPTLLEVARAKGTLKPSYLKQQSGAGH